MEDATFGELLKAFRKRIKMSQKELARTLGKHLNTIGTWERGDCLPDAKGTVLEVAKQLRLNEHETRQLLEASLTALSSYWYVPFQRNPFFTGRDDVLRRLHSALGHGQITTLSQSCALSGLGGIGKTQTTIEYAYRYAYEYMGIFWINAETPQSLVASLVAIADLLHLPEKQEQEQDRIVTAVVRWFNSHGDWLLIFDNVEDINLVKSVLPSARRGCLLFTSRRQALGFSSQTLDLEPMTLEEGMRFLLSRARRLDSRMSFDQLSAEEVTCAQEIVLAMSGLPLALDQAGAYIEETGCSLAYYCTLYQTHCAVLLDQRGQWSQDHPHSVVRTLTLSI